nr:MAG TPA: hypothetical protein [Caudoviricetes sp.]
MLTSFYNFLSLTHARTCNYGGPSSCIRGDLRRARS